MLQTLDLAGNQIGDEGTKALAEAVKNNKVKCILSIH
jgi:Ran GTPase-activating protein (RanGAP) involved in mRNA processing and transport